MQFLAGNAVALLENGGQYFPALEAEIDRAEREIKQFTDDWQRDNR